MKRSWPFHPIAFAAYPVLSLYAANTSLFPSSDLWRPLGAVLLATLLAWGLLWLVLRSPERSAAGASVLVIGFFSFGPILSLLHLDPSARTYEVHEAMAVWGPSYAILFVAACWKWRRTSALTRGLNVAGLVLAVVPCTTIALAWLQGTRVPARRSPDFQGAYQGPRPDVFFVVLDGYGRSDVLREEMGFDNSEFLDGLKKLGFYVADESRANYCQTELSVTSILNMDYLPKVIPNYSPENVDRRPLDSLIDRNRVSQDLRALGYTYIALTTGFPAIDPESADLQIQAQNGGTLFETAVMQRTPLAEGGGFEGSQFIWRRQTLTTAIRTLGELGRPASRPRFVFAHILAPHPPFVFGPNGEPIRPKRGYMIVDGSHFMQNGGTREEYRTGYAGQAKTVGRMVLDSIKTLLKNERTPPIIVIQGDHGPKLNLDQESLAKTSVGEVFPILNAYYVPEKVKSKLYPGITPVNSFRTIFRQQFGADLPNLEDRSFYSAWSFPYRFEDVTSQVTGPTE